MRAKSPYGEASFNGLYGKYKYKAKQRKLAFDLSKDEFRKLTKEICFYCGEPPVREYLNSPRQLTTNGYYIYNGVDRKDSSLGYNIDNCVACCYTCNVAKQQMSVEEFFKLIKKIYERIRV